MSSKYKFNESGTTLVLNRDGQALSLFPLSVIGWQDAVKSVYSGTVEVIKSHDVVARSASGEIQIPSIVMTKNWINDSRYVKFSRRNLYMRDGYRCQYCGLEFTFNELTIDHVKAKRYGGKITWTNSVSACQPCNNKKSHFSIMKPMKKPNQPTYYQMVERAKNFPMCVYDDWNYFLQWPDDLVIVKNNIASLSELCDTVQSNIK
jgi:5-methylcytosine-specific restriction endonuclease McrA